MKISDKSLLDRELTLEVSNFSATSQVLKEDTVYQIGRGGVSVDESYQRIGKALNALRHIADTMSDNGYYETEESALRCQINYIEQELNYIRNH